MKLADVIKILTMHEARTDGFGVRSPSVFGSVANNTASDNSDIDVIVGFNGAATFSGYMGLKLMLEEVLGQQVDFVTMRALRTELREAVLQEAVRVA